MCFIHLYTAAALFATVCVDTMIGQEQVYTRLKELNIDFHYLEHPPAPSIEIGKQYWSHLPGIHCKNLFFRNHKGKQHYLVVFHCEQNLAIRELELKLKQGKLSFASVKRMAKYLGLQAGSVSPFGLINDHEHHVYVFLDKNLKNFEFLSFHPNDNRASLTIKSSDFVRYIEASGNKFEWLELY